MKDMFNPSQHYMRIGNQIETILLESDVSAISFAPEKSKGFVSVMALVTLFQYVEGYTDSQAAEAARARADWKYALHLPMSYPGFEPLWLCKFRESMFGSAGGAAVIQSLADHLGETGLFDQNSTLQIIEILTSVCQLNRLVEIAEAMLLAVEALAAYESAWLQTLPLPCLYEQYAKTFRTIREVRTEEQVSRLAYKIGVDVVYVLNLIEASGEDDLRKIPEICTLREILENQYERPETEGVFERPLSWRPVDCLHCRMKPGKALSV